MTQKITFILPAYKETKSIHQLILDLHEAVPNNSSIIVIDDSPTNQTYESVQTALQECGWDINNSKVIKNAIKGGRGHAVKLGLQYALKNDSTNCFVEMDSDGSHSATMALKVAQTIPEYDFCVGSRYLPESQIVGWSLARRVFSRVINLILRTTFNDEITDWTNGLRAYSRQATETLCEHESLTTGFIYLSEQAVILTNHNFKICQVPIRFLDRTHGESSVTWRELANSLTGVFRILTLRKK